MSKIKHGLTKREKEVLNAIIEKGLFHRKDIANYLNIAECTLCSYLVHIYDVTNSHSIAELIYKQLQKSQNTIIVGLQILIMLLANNSKLNKCLDEIEKYVDNFCENVCPYYVDEGESCDNCMVGDIVQPIKQNIKKVKDVKGGTNENR